MRRRFETELAPPCVKSVDRCITENPRSFSHDSSPNTVSAARNKQSISCNTTVSEGFPGDVPLAVSHWHATPVPSQKLSWNKRPKFQKQPQTWKTTQWFLFWGREERKCRPASRRARPSANSFLQTKSACLTRQMVTCCDLFRIQLEVSCERLAG